MFNVNQKQAGIGSTCLDININLYTCYHDEPTYTFKNDALHPGIWFIFYIVNVLLFFFLLSHICVQLF